MTLYRAKVVLPIASPPIEDGVVAVEDERIAAIGRVTDFSGPFTDLGECVVLPGFINAHCHLDYTNMAGFVTRRGSFADWIGDMIALKQKWTLAHYEASAQNGLVTVLRSGTTTVCDMEAEPANLDVVAAAPVRVLSCLELINVAAPAASETLWGRCSGLSPHAPFSASISLYRHAAKFCRDRQRIFTSHVAESLDEVSLFEKATGPLHERLAALGRPMDDCGRGSSVALLDGYGLLNDMLVVHANCVSDDDVSRLARARTSVVHCPSSHRFFGHPPFPLERLRAAGVNVCLGTDSAASGTTLDMRGEMRDFLSVFPGVRPIEALGMATVASAKALNQSGLTGTLSVGSRADFIAAPVSGTVRDAAETVIAGRESVRLSVVNGKVVHRE